MMPGHEDREDHSPAAAAASADCAAMMPGHEDREDPPCGTRPAPACACRNDARSRRPGRLERPDDDLPDLTAAMMPGHEDREDPLPAPGSHDTHTAPQ